MEHEESLNLGRADGTVVFHNTLGELASDGHARFGGTPVESAEHLLDLVNAAPADVLLDVYSAGSDQGGI